MVLGAADDVVRAPDLVGAKAQMAMLRLAGFRVRSDHLDLAARPDSAPTDGRAAVLRMSKERRSSRRCASSSRSTTPARARRRSRPRPGRLRAATRPRSSARAVQLQRRDRRQRAEPQPLLAATVRRRAARTSPRRPTSPCSRKTYDALKAVRPRTAGVGRRALPPRHRPSGTGLATPTRRRSSSSTSESRTARAGGRPRSWTGSRSTPTARTRACSPEFAHPRNTVIGIADYTKLVGLLATGLRRQRPERVDAADPLCRVRGRVDGAPGQADALLGGRADDDQARRRGEAGGVLREGAGAHVLPAECRGLLRLPRDGREAARSLAVGRPLRRRDSEGEPTGRCETLSSAPVAARSPAARGSRCQSRRPTLRYPGRPRSGTRESRVRLRCNLDCVYSVRLRKAATARRRSRAAAARKPVGWRSSRSAAAGSLPAATTTPSSSAIP